MYTTSFSVACLALSMACIVFPAQCFTAQKCLVKGQIGSQRQNGFSHIQIIDSSLHVSSEIGDASSPSIPNAGSSDSNQSKYGNDLPIPSSYVRCGRCQSLFALKPEDLGPKGKGSRVSCSLCNHSWYQSRDKLFNINDGFELVSLPELDINRVKSNLEAGRRPNFMGVSKLYVGNLDFKCTEEDLVGLFSEKAGEVGDVTIVRDPTGRSRGFGFVTMMTEEGGAKGFALDGEQLLGRNLQIREPNN